MLDFNALLELAGLNPASTVAVRHFPVEKQLRKVLPWLVEDRANLWLTYQRIQWESLEKAMTKATHVASFIGEGPGQATSAGIYRIGGSEVLDHAGYCVFPGNRELEALGMSGRSPDMPDCLAFDLQLLENYRDWIGKLTIRWPKPYQNWWRWTGRGSFPVDTIEAESRFVRGMPSWPDIVLDWNELQCLPASWKASLAKWRGVYLIHDSERRRGYVGSAVGGDNILGRWLGYASTGHGGNRELRRSNPINLRFSILERTSPDLDMSELVMLKASWRGGCPRGSLA